MESGSPPEPCADLFMKVSQVKTFGYKELPMKKKLNLKQIFAIIAIVLLAGLYISCLVLALIQSEWATKLLKLSIVMTILVPVTIYIFMMFYRLSHRKDDLEDDQP